MISHSNMMAVAGCVVMAGLAIAAVGLHVDSDGGLSNVFSGRDNVPVNENPLNTSVPSPPQRSVIDGTSDADVQFILQAISDNLQRNDLTSARVLLDSVLATRKEQSRAHELQKELQARESESKRNAVARYASAPAPALGATRNDVSHRIQPTADRAPRHSRNRKEMARNTRSALESRAAPARSAQASPVTSLQDSDYRYQNVSRDRHSKTRAEVREELRRARADGSISRYGNPDARGPGGSLNDTSRR
ncbi:hypothetical protein LJR267_009208 [Paraburkholderia hospita]|jgi:hypothetical protein|uniref:DUF4148 domain-containing protein n=1 Tax=Paraburkholderia hospita TaxID=169430 RepID=UPI003ECC6675